MNQELTSIALFSMTALTIFGTWALARLRRRDEQISLLLDKLGEIDFGGRLADDSLSIYQGAHQAMIDANTNIVNRVPDSVRVLAEEQKLVNERFSVFQADLEDLADDIEELATQVAREAAVGLVLSEIQSSRTANAGDFTNLHSLVAELSARTSTVLQNQSDLAATLGGVFRTFDEYQRQAFPLLQQMSKTIDREFS